MFSLIYGILQYLLRQDEVKLLVIGLDKAGKTTLLENLKSQFSEHGGLEPQKIYPTVGLNVGNLKIRHQKVIAWDLGGAAALRRIWERYYSECHGLVYVVDAANQSRFEESKDTLGSILTNVDLAGAPLLVVVNKQDDHRAADIGTVTDVFGLSELNATCKVLPASGLTGDGVQQGFIWLVEQVLRSQRFYLLRQRDQQQSSFHYR